MELPARGRREARLAARRERGGGGRGWDRGGHSPGHTHPLPAPPPPPPAFCACAAAVTLALYLCLLPPPFFPLLTPPDFIYTLFWSGGVLVGISALLAAFPQEQADAGLPLLLFRASSRMNPRFAPLPFPGLLAGPEASSTFRSRLFLFRSQHAAPGRPGYLRGRGQLVWRCDCRGHTRRPLCWRGHAHRISCLVCRHLPVGNCRKGTRSHRERGSGHREIPGSLFFRSRYILIFASSRLRITAAPAPGSRRPFQGRNQGVGGRRRPASAPFR